MHALSVNEGGQNNNEDLRHRVITRETLRSDGNENRKHPTGKTNRYRPVNRKQRQKKLQVTVILGDSIVKQVTKLSDKNKIVTKQFKTIQWSC